MASACACPRGFVSGAQEWYKRLATSGVALMDQDLTYFVRRAAQERSAATNASGKARKAHKEMAERYRRLVRSDEAPSRTEAVAND